MYIQVSINKVKNNIQLSYNKIKFYKFRQSFYHAL